MARAFADTVYAASGKFPRKEEYGLTSQINRAVNSISLNIAEGSAKKSNRAFDYQLEIAIGSAFEVVAEQISHSIENTFPQKTKQRSTPKPSGSAKASTLSEGRFASA